MARRFDDWVRHPTAFSFSQLEVAAAAAQPPRGGMVLDPFVGTGKALTFVAGRGERAVGIEAHPLIAELATLKLARPGVPADLLESTEDLAAAARRAASTADPTREAEVLRRFIDNETLRELIGWREAVDVVECSWRNHLRWLVLAALRDVVGQSWPYPNVRRAPRKRPQAVRDLIRSRALMMVQDLAAAPQFPQARVIEGDAREASTWGSIELGSIEASISSPPYLNQVSYAEITRLELHFLGLVSSWREMSQLVATRLLASSTQQVNRSRAKSGEESLAASEETFSAVGRLAQALKQARRERPKGKPYDLLAWAYFGEFRSVLCNLRRALAPGARAAWVVGDSALYGVHVDTPTLLGLLAQEVGLEVLDDIHLRERGHRWPRVGGRHRRSLSERLLVLRRPPLSSQPPLPGLALRQA